MLDPTSIEQLVKNNLEHLAVRYEWIPIDPMFADTAGFCEQYGFPIHNSGNTIILSSKKGAKQHSACVVLGIDRLDVNKTVRNLMGVPRLSFADADETISLTGMMIGGVTPFGLPESLPIYVDSMVMNLDYLILGGGNRTGKVKIHPSGLMAIPNVKVITGLSKPRGLNFDEPQ